jgi:CDP-diacylglycerol--serine O-phosphatidyltransferase
MVGIKRIRPRIGGAVYILPNLLTTGNLFFGYFSVVKSLQGQFSLACLYILVASVFDVLDGRVARLTHGTSEFGVQYDSLSDLISFGMAPAFLMYQFGLSNYGRIGWILCFVFLACGALRLARFNVQSSIGKAAGDFTGLPIPMAAIVVATYIALVCDLDSTKGGGIWLLEKSYELITNLEVRNGILLGMAPALAFLMVSNISYRSHKSIKSSSIKPFRLLAILVVLIGMMAYQPEFCGFVLVFAYAVSGPFEWVAGWKKLEDDDEIFSPHTGDSSIMEPFVEEDGTLEDDGKKI